MAPHEVRAIRTACFTFTLSFAIANVISRYRAFASGIRSLGATAGARPCAAVVDESQPTTVIQLILADKSKLRQKFNLSATVLDVYQHVQHASRAAAPFELIAGFPPKALTDAGATVKDAGLAGASVTQKTA